jgi:predicted Zn finger-like uncharacterized protein
MIIRCEECQSTFNLDENLLKEEGSKVRCSVCKHVFLAYPPVDAPEEEIAPDDLLDEDLEETVPLDSPPVVDQQELAIHEEVVEPDLDEVFGDSEEDKTVQFTSQDTIPDLEEEAEMGEAIDRAAKTEEEIAREDMEKKIEETVDRDAGAGDVVPPEKKRRGSRGLMVILMLLLLLVGVLVAIYLLAPNLLPDFLALKKPAQQQDVADIGVRGLSIKEQSLSGLFIQSESAGPLFVIKGTVVNNYPKSRSFILIKSSILDDKGEVINSKMAYAGNTFEEEQLKQMSVEEIDKELKDRFGKERMNFDVRPGGAVPFMIVFENLPEDPDVMSEYTVEPVSSAPGNQ